MQVECAAVTGDDLIDAGNGEAAAWEQLARWQRNRTQLGFVYSRSLGGLVQNGRGIIGSLSAASLEIVAGPCNLLVALPGAHCEAGPQVFFTPALTGAFDVHGVAISLSNHDWLFFSEFTIPSNSALLAR